ncbi:hypothetical protein, partial [Variovorax sp. Sphag1AA]|uniref:hypothetical protein n=1 Tax=Variovorax sp. Sphag1AA TaxID=2587027 RepID=UPI001C843929
VDPSCQSASNKFVAFNIGDPNQFASGFFNRIQREQPKGRADREWCSVPFAVVPAGSSVATNGPVQTVAP